MSATHDDNAALYLTVLDLLCERVLTDPDAVTGATQIQNLSSSDPRTLGSAAPLAAQIAVVWSALLTRRAAGDHQTWDEQMRRCAAAWLAAGRSDHTQREYLRAWLPTQHAAA